MGGLANALRGVVIATHDGDILTLLDDSKTQYRIRLAGIDAPEMGQPFGQRSKEGLSDLVYRRKVTIDWHKHDRYGKVSLGDRDVNLTHVGAGLAWHYVNYTREQAPADLALYSQSEAKARDAHLAPWQDAAPLHRGSFGSRSASAGSDFRPALHLRVAAPVTPGYTFLL